MTALRPTHRLQPIARRIARVCGTLGTALICIAPIDASSDPIEGREEGRVLYAAAHHQHSNRGPAIPTSPGGHGMQRIAGYRIYEASAVHPFAVGFDHSRMPAAVPQVDVWVGRAGRRFGRPARN